MNLSEHIWTCKVCGAWNAAYLTECGKCKEDNMKKKRQYRSRQGRSDRQYLASIKVIGAAAILLFGSLFVMSIYKLITEVF